MLEETVSLKKAEKNLDHEDYEAFKKRYDQIEEKKIPDTESELKQFEQYGPADLYTLKGDEEAGLKEKQAWDQQSEKVCAAVYEWMENVHHTAAECSKEYDQNKNVLAWFMIRAIEINEPDILKKQNAYEGKNVYVFHHGLKDLKKKAQQNYPLTALTEFQSVMNDHFEKIHKQSLKWAQNSQNLSVSSFDMYQVLASELGKDFMTLKDDEGDEISSVILFSFSELMEKDIPAVLNTRKETE